MKSRRLRWVSHAARMAKKITGKPLGRIHLGRPRRRWEDNIRMDLRNRCQYEEID